MSKTLKSRHRTAGIALALLMCASLQMPAQKLSGGTALEPALAGMVLIPAGVYTAPFQRGKEAVTIQVKPFYLDIFPVTNAEFLEFVRANSQWRRSRVQPDRADKTYLRHWAGDLEIGSASPQAPVTSISWFAARAFAQWKSKRLPRLAEWELAAAASPLRADGANDPQFQKEIARWYSTPAPAQLPKIGAGRANVFGAHDLHGLVWEWISDFNAPWATDAADAGAEAFCGGGAQTARDRTDYPVFMRFGFRHSLQAGYCVNHLGFRCARNGGQTDSFGFNP